MNQRPVLTLIVSSNSGVRTLEVRRCDTIRLAAIFAVAASLFMFGYVSLFKTVYEHYAAWDAQRTNSRLTSQLSAISDQITLFDTRLRNVFQFDDRVRTIFDLEPVTKEARLVGIGGSGIATGLDADLNRIARQVSFESWKLRQAYTGIASKLELFSRIPLITPTSGRITSPFGVRVHPILERSHFHEGIDIANDVGTIIQATANGMVTKIGYHEISGRYLRVRHNASYETFYAHLEDIFVKEGEHLHRFQPIATLGNTGRSTGSHLHYEVIADGTPINPVSLIIRPPDIVVD